MVPIHELRVVLPSPDAIHSPRDGMLAPRASDSEAARFTAGAPEPLMRVAVFEDVHHAQLGERYPHLFHPYEFCLEHPVIPYDTTRLLTWLRHVDTIMCEALVQKTGHGPMIREPNDGWWRRVEETNDNHVWPGDAFLVRRDEREYEYFTEPVKQLPADWTPCAGTLAQQRDERMRAHRTINKDRSKAQCIVCYDYLTVYTTSGNWRRKMVAYERGTPSPFSFEYYDARNHHPLFHDHLSS